MVVPRHWNKLNQLLHCTLLVSSVLGAGVSRAAAQEWTRFRGPNGTGVTETRLPVKWTDQQYAWQIDLPGVGHSSPVVWGDRLFVTAADIDEGRFLLCIETSSGKMLWKHDQPLKAYKKHKNNSYASSTPCVDEEHVYAVWHGKDSSQLVALTHQGKAAWSVELGPYLHGQGGASSPIVYEDLVVLANDQKSPSFLLAVDRRTGKERWKIDREGKRACYSTPCVFQGPGGTPELIFSHCFEGIIGVDPKTGKRNWHVDVFGRASQRALGSPVCTNKLVIATSGGVGGEKQMVAVKPTGDAAQGYQAVEAWRTFKHVPHVPTPLVYKEWVFLWSDQGIAVCLDKVTGTTIWRERVGGNYFSSPICAGGRIYCVDLDGVVGVIDASDKFRVLAKNDLGQGSKATPAVSGGMVFFRTESKLFALGAEN